MPNADVVFTAEKLGAALAAPTIGGAVLASALRADAAASSSNWCSGLTNSAAADA